MIQLLAIDVNWTAVWQMTGVGIGVVFVILILLVFVLQGFSVMAKRLNAAPKPAAAKSPAVAPVASPAVSAPADDEAAIATALYLYFQDVHDEESYKLTIKHADHPAWHSELNHHLSNN